MRLFWEIVENQHIDVLFIQKNLAQNNIIKEFLRKGGLRCEILTSANIKVGDEIKVL